MTRKRNCPPPAWMFPDEGARWTRAAPAALAAFDPSSKVCVMNCGPHRDDPRSNAERKLLCDDCLVVKQ